MLTYSTVHSNPLKCFSTLVGQSWAHVKHNSPVIQMNDSIDVPNDFLKEISGFAFTYAQFFLLKIDKNVLLFRLGQCQTFFHR